jgi:hypothetical protein
MQLYDEDIPTSSGCLVRPKPTRISSPNFWGVAGDIGGRHIAALFAVINSIGALGAAGAQLLFGYVPGSEWGHAFAACGGLLAVGTACGALVDSRQPMRDLA